MLLFFSHFKLFSSGNSNIDFFYGILVEKDYKIIRDSMFKFIENVARIGAVSIETDVNMFINSINNMFNRMVNNPTQNIIIKQLRQLF